MAQIVSGMMSGNSHLSVPQSRPQALSCHAPSNRFGSQRFHEARSSRCGAARGPCAGWGSCASKAARSWGDYVCLEDIERVASAAEVAFSGMEDALAETRAWSSTQSTSAEAIRTDGESSEVRIRVDSVKTEEAYLFYADVPGVKIRDVKVQARPERRELTISGERFPPADLESDDESSGSSRRERRFGKFRRTFNLPEDANLSKLSASSRDGVLTVYVTRTASEEPEVQNVPIEEWSTSKDRNNDRNNDRSNDRNNDRNDGLRGSEY